MGGRFRTFMEVHLAKSRRIGRLAGAPVPHVFTTSYLTHAPIADSDPARYLSLPGARRVE